MFGTWGEQVEDHEGRGLVLWCELFFLDCSVLLLLTRFYGALLGTVCVLYLLPLCWVLAIFNSTLFLGNTQFYQGKRPSWKWPVWDWMGKGPLKQGSCRGPLPTPSCELSVLCWALPWDLNTTKGATMS